MWTQLMAVLLEALLNCDDDDCSRIADEFRKAATVQWCTVPKK